MVFVLLLALLTPLVLLWLVVYKVRFGWKKSLSDGLILALAAIALGWLVTLITVIQQLLSGG